MIENNESTYRKFIQNKEEEWMKEESSYKEDLEYLVHWLINYGEVFE